MTNTVVMNNSIHQKKGGSSQNIKGTTLSMIQPNIKHHRDGYKRHLTSPTERARGQVPDPLDTVG